MSEVIAISKDGRATIVRESSGEQFDQLVDLITDNLALSSQRVYRQTYQQWRQFAARKGHDCFDLSFENLSLFLNGRELAGATRRSWKAHMLRLLDWLEESPTRGRMVRQTAAACAQVRQGEADGGRARRTPQPKSPEPDRSRAAVGCMGGRWGYGTTPCCG